MNFVFIGHDKPGHLDLRLEHRPAHVTWLKESPIPVAGPLLDDDGNPCGSMVICDVEDMAAAQALFAADPYAKAGLFASTEIKPWKWVLGAPE